MRAYLGATLVIIFLCIFSLVGGLQSIYNNSGVLGLLITNSLGIQITKESGPQIGSGRNLILANHPNFMDGFYLVLWAIHQNILPRIRFIVADWVGKIPLSGFGDHHFIKVKRDWISDKETLTQAISQMPEDAIVFILPEGTTFCPGSLEKTIDYARKHNIPEFNYLLSPRYKGLELILQIGKWDSIYDLTLHYPERKSNPFIGSDFEYINWGNYPRTCSIELHKIKDIPKDNIEKWLYHLWQRKDVRLKANS